MLTQTAYKTKLKTNNAEKETLRRCSGAARYVYNWGLAEWQAQYSAGGKPSAFALKKQFNSIKDELCPWIRAIPSSVGESAFANLGAAYKNFFRRVKNGEEPGYPRYKRHGNKRSFQVRLNEVGDACVRLQILGTLRLAERGYIPVAALKYGIYVTISEQVNEWYISVLAYADVPTPNNTSVLVVGVDFGIKELAVCSDGRVFSNPKPYRDAKLKIARLSRELSRRNKNGANWHKTQLKIQKLNLRIANIRKYTLHQISHALVVKRPPRVIVIEDLNVSGMLKNHKLAQAIADAGFYELRRQIEYKAKRNGVQVIFADRWFPSSRQCSTCGWRHPSLTLRDREFVCAECGLIIDRDLNAALNLAKIAVVV